MTSSDPKAGPEQESRRDPGGSAPAPQAACRACRAPLAPGALACPRCGAPQIDDAPCPHCGAVAAVMADEQLRYRCGVCGGARLPLAVRGSAGARAAPSLLRAEAARRARTSLRIAAVAMGGAAALTGLVALALGFAIGSMTALFVLAVIALPFGALSAALAARARKHAADVPVALDEAWLAVAKDIAERSEAPLAPEELAAALGVDVPRAEALLALLDASDVVRGEVGDDGQLRYMPRVRVAAGARASDPSAGVAKDDTAIQAELEDAEHEDAAARARQRQR